jgi:hypothetical protein
MAKKLKGAGKALMSLKEAKFEDDGNVFDQLPDGILDNIFTRCRLSGGELGRPSATKPLANIRLVNKRFAEGGFRCLTTVVVPREGFQRISLPHLRNTVKPFRGAHITRLFIDLEDSMDKKAESVLRVLDKHKWAEMELREAAQLPRLWDASSETLVGLPCPRMGASLNNQPFFSHMWSDKMMREVLGGKKINHKFDPNLTEFLEDNQNVARLHITFVKEVFQVAVERFAPSGYSALQELVLQVNEGDMLVQQRVMNWKVGLEMVFRLFPALQELRLLHWGSFGLVGETRKVGLPNIQRFYLGSSEYESWYWNDVKEGSHAVDELALLDMPAVEHLEILGLVPFVHRPSPFEAYPALLASMP